MIKPNWLSVIIHLRYMGTQSNYIYVGIPHYEEAFLEKIIFETHIYAQVFFFFARYPKLMRVHFVHPLISIWMNRWSLCEQFLFLVNVEFLFHHYHSPKLWGAHCQFHWCHLCFYVLQYSLLFNDTALWKKLVCFAMPAPCKTDALCVCSAHTTLCHFPWKNMLIKFHRGRFFVKYSVLR